MSKKRPPTSEVLAYLEASIASRQGSYDSLHAEARICDLSGDRETAQRLRRDALTERRRIALLEEAAAIVRSVDWKERGQ